MIVISQIGSGQEANGFFMGRNKTLISSSTNPAFTTQISSPWELQLAGIHAFFDTDYGHIFQSNLWVVSNNLNRIRELPYSDALIPRQNYLAYKVDDSQSHIDSRAELSGPGFFYRINDRWNVGLSVGGRAVASVFDIPEVLNYYPLNNSFTETEYFSESLYGSGFAWVEYSLHLAYRLRRDLDIGINLSITDKHIGGAADISNNVLYISDDISTVRALTGGEFSIATVENANGQGLNIDLGVVKHNVFVKGDHLGISILDLGGTFTVDGRDLKLRYTPGDVIVREDYRTLTDSEDLYDQLVEDFELVSDNSNVPLLYPTAISLQYHKPTSKYWSMNLAWTQRINLSRKQLRRSNSVVAAMVYDRKNLAIHIPLTFYEYKNVKAGLAARFYYLTIGSDDVFSLFTSQRRFNSSDFYISLNLYPIINPNKRKKPSKKNVECYSF